MYRNPDPPCIDLRTAADYRVRNEIEDRPAHKTDDPWTLTLPGRAGFIAPWDARRLVACTNGNAIARRLLREVPGASGRQVGSDGSNVVFPADALPTVAGILRLKRRRKMSDAQRVAALANLRRTARRNGG